MQKGGVHGGRVLYTGFNIQLDIIMMSNKCYTITTCHCFYPYNFNYKVFFATTEHSLVGATLAYIWISWVRLWPIFGSRGCDSGLYLDLVGATLAYIWISWVRLWPIFGSRGCDSGLYLDLVGATLAYN